MKAGVESGFFGARVVSHRMAFLPTSYQRRLPPRGAVLEEEEKPPSIDLC